MTDAKIFCKIYSSKQIRHSLLATLSLHMFSQLSHCPGEFSVFLTNLVTELWPFAVKNSRDTASIVGRSFWSADRQADARLRTKRMSCSCSFVGWGRRESRTSSEIFLRAGWEDSRVDRSSPGCLPIIVSSATTPKLYTSHFSFICMVYASSAEWMG